MLTYDELMEVIVGRRSVRRYRDEPVSEELILRVIEAARWAPSAANSQPWHFIVIRSPARRRALAERARLFGVLRWKHLASAPVVIAVVGDPRANRWYQVDCSLAGQNLLLAAQTLNLSTCWIGGFEQDQIRGLLEVPESREVVGLVTLGYPGRVPQAPPRLPLGSIVSWEAFDPASAAGPLRRLGCTKGPSLVKKALRLRPDPDETSG